MNLDSNDYSAYLYPCTYAEDEDYEFDDGGADYYLQIPFNLPSLFSLVCLCVVLGKGGFLLFLVVGISDLLLLL